MATTEIAVHGSATSADRKPIVNDFSIQVATVNGSGSQSANTVLLRSIFQMGVPVSGKNLFPSNIAGLPTWYTIRASKKGYIARKKEIDFVVAMNPETAREDVLGLAAGAAVLYDEPLKLNELRTDLVFYSVPFDKIVATVCPEAKLRKLVRNMIYVGVMAQLLNLDMTEVEKALRKQFAKKVKAAEMNWNAAKAGYDYAVANLTKSDPFTVERMDKTQGMIIIDGNSAAAMGSMFAGVTVVTWYPITPSSSLVESLIDYMKAYRVGADGKATFAIVQAEDELAAIGMVLGAGWAGARAMTATAGPGISLMAEFAGLGYYVEIPGVIWDVQRVGPSTGLPTRTSQGDIEFVAKLSHGDTAHPMLIPCSVAECFSMASEAFNLAEQLQTPGVRDVRPGPRHEQLDVGTVPVSRRSRSIAAKCCPKKTSTGWAGSRATKTWTATASAIARCRESSIRKERGSRAAAGITRKRSTASAPTTTRTISTVCDISSSTRARLVPKPEMVRNDGNDIGVIAYGTSHHAMVETLDQLQGDHGVKVDYLRLKAYPFTSEVHDFVASHKRIYVVDQNRDGQMFNLLKLDIPAEDVVRLRSVRHYNGLPIDARSVTDDIVSQEGK